jgi:hypothetical protein
MPSGGLIAGAATGPPRGGLIVAGLGAGQITRL